MGDITVTARVEGGDELIQTLRKMGVSVDRELPGAVEAGGEVIRKDAEHRAPGPYIEKEIAEQGRGYAVVAIGPDVGHWYYQFLETGAGAHEITPRAPGGRLVFEGRGGTVVTGHVSHPGMAASPFLRPAIDSKRSAARDEVGDVLRRKALE